ncbi:hypothetical protein N9594_01115 [bacterium]|nr:hypothetical protein [bacterium]
MKYLSLVRLLAIVVFGLLSSCSDKDESAMDKDESAMDKDESAMDKDESAMDKDERVLKEFKEGPIAALNVKENLKKLEMDGHFFWPSRRSYDVKKTDSLTSPYTALIYVYADTCTEWKILMVYQNDKWVFIEESFTRGEHGVFLTVKKSGNDSERIKMIESLLETK